MTVLVELPGDLLLFVWVLRKWGDDFFAKGNIFFPVMSGSGATMNNKLKIRTFQKGRENGLGDGLGWKQVFFFSRTLLQPTTEEGVCGSFEFPVYTSGMLIRA